MNFEMQRAPEYKRKQFTAISVEPILVAFSLKICITIFLEENISIERVFLIVILGLIAK